MYVLNLGVKGMTGMTQSGPRYVRMRRSPGNCRGRGGGRGGEGGRGEAAD